MKADEYWINPDLTAQKVCHYEFRLMFWLSSVFQGSDWGNEIMVIFVGTSKTISFVY